MKKTILAMSMALALAAVTACGGKGSKDAAGSTNGQDESPAMQLLNSVPFTADGLKSMIKTAEKESLTDVEYEALWMAYSKVDINEDENTLENTDELKTIRELFRSHKSPANASAIQEKLLTSTSPQVKGMAMSQFTSLFGVNQENVNKLLKALEGETNPFVLSNGIRAVSNELTKEGVAPFVFEQAKSASKFVRKEAAIAICNPWSEGVEGVKEAALPLLSDSDDDVRKCALTGVGRLNDESYVDELVKVLNDTTLYRLHGAAARGLYYMWYDYPFHKRTSKKAYDATVKYLSQKPRTKHVPDWTSVGELKNRSEDGIADWKARATYYSDAAWVKLMQDIALDPNAEWLGRSAAIDVIEKIGTKADLQKVQAGIKALSNDSKADMLLSSLEKKLQ